jgi:hypothetical protein
MSGMVQLLAGLVSGYVQAATVVVGVAVSIALGVVVGDVGNAEAAASVAAGPAEEVDMADALSEAAVGSWKPGARQGVGLTTVAA